jgi:FG-GAP-like repeat
MKHGLAVCALASSLVLVLGLAGCDDDDDGCCDHETTDVIGRVVLAGNPVAGANVRIIFAGFIQDTEVTMADGTFKFDDYPEVWDPFFVEAFWIDPVTLNEYQGVSPSFLTNESGNTNIGDIVLVQTFPATAGNVVSAYLDGDGLEDFVGTYPDALFVWLSDGGLKLLATASLTAAPFGPIAISDLDGDGNKDLAVTRIGTPEPEVWTGDGRGGFVKADDG